MTGNLLYAQSGGVTAVINASAAGVIAEARLQPERIGRVLAARNGILGVLRETLVDTAGLLDPDLRRLRATPGGAFAIQSPLKNSSSIRLSLWGPSA